MGKFEKLHTNQRLLLEELESRGAKIQVLIPELEIVEVTLGHRHEILTDRDSSRTPYAGSLLAANKYVTKLLLKRAGLPVPSGEMFYADQFDDALRFATSINGPKVVKPPIGSHGEDCITDICSMEDLVCTIERFISDRGTTAPFLLEEQVAGIEVRMFVTEKGDYAALERDPASIIGDGASTIERLIHIENQRRGIGPGRPLCQIPIDAVVLRTLSAAGLSLSAIPKLGNKIYLRRNSNLATGGRSIDITERVHPTVIDIAKRALKVFPGLPFAGVDLLCSNPEIAVTQSKVFILEVNSNPGFTMHMRPAEGKSRNVAAYVADVLFPDSHPRMRSKNYD
jgi:cyanophycin synthetase